MNGKSNWRAWSFLLATIFLASGCIRNYEVVEDPRVILQLAEDTPAEVWIPVDGKLVRVWRLLEKGDLVIDRRHPVLDVE